MARRPSKPHPQRPQERSSNFHASACKLLHMTRDQNSKRHEQHRQGPRVAMFLTIAACAVNVGRADTVLDSRGVFADVSVVGMDDGKLVFKFKDGRAVSRGVALLKEITVATGSDPAADELSRAESLRGEKQYQQAATLYERARTLSS